MYGYLCFELDWMHVDISRLTYKEVTDYNYLDAE